MALRRRWDQLASEPDCDFTARYELKRPPVPPGLYWKLRWLAGRILRELQSRRLLPAHPWPVALKSSRAKARAKPLLIWAVGTDRDSLRTSCEKLRGAFEALTEFAPVLVTDVADFGFFSRLGWLVEYLPRVAGEGVPYEERKLRLLARLYRGAPILPVSVGSEEVSAPAIRRWAAASSGAPRPIQG